MHGHHKRVLLDDQVVIREALVELVAVLIDDTAKRDGNVPERDDDVAPDTRVTRRFEDFEQQVVVLVAELGTDTQEFGK